MKNQVTNTTVTASSDASRALPSIERLAFIKAAIKRQANPDSHRLAEAVLVGFANDDAAIYGQGFSPMSEANIDPFTITGVRRGFRSDSDTRGEVA